MSEDRPQYQAERTVPMNAEIAERLRAMSIAEFSGADRRRWNDMLGCRRRERWLISRNTRRVMSLRCIAATHAREKPE